MLMIIKPNKINSAKRVFKKWDLSFSSIGEITKDTNIKITSKNVVADIPLDFLTNAKVFRRPLPFPYI